MFNKQLIHWNKCKPFISLIVSWINTQKITYINIENLKIIIFGQLVIIEKLISLGNY